MVTLTTAENALRTVYLDVLTDQINTKTSPFYNMVHAGSEDVVGKDVIVPSRYGINGGVGSGSEDGTLPSAGGNNYINFKADLVNIFGNIELSDKVLRASENTTGGLVSILNAEMEGLLASAKFNFARMLFQSGNGLLGTVSTHASITANTLPVDNTRNFMEGMVIDILSSAGAKIVTGIKITFVDRAARTIKLQPNVSGVTSGCLITLQQSYNAELLGLPYLFLPSGTIYGNSRLTNPHLLPTSKTATELSTDAIQETLDTVDEKSGGSINLILTSYDMRRKYFSHLRDTRTNIDYMNLDGGFHALSYNGIPLFVDRFAENNTMYFVNTEDFKLQQLADWTWIESDSGRILRQLDNKPAYGATLVKYANLICARPAGQARLIVEE